MIKTLRKRHLQVWIAMALLVPAGIVAAYMAVKKPVTDHLLQPVPAIVFPVVIRSIEKENCAISIRRTADSSKFQLQWVNKSVLTEPTATIYQVNSNKNNISDNKFIGRIEARGSYCFPGDSSFLEPVLKLIVYDFIHKQIIDTITF